MKNINPTTRAALKILDAAIEMMKEASSPQDTKVLEILRNAKTNAETVCREDIPTKRAQEKIYTDGACSGNPGPGGWGLVRIMNGNEDDIQKQSSGYRLTTNNRMEVMAAINAVNLYRSQPTDIEIISDSKYVTDAINKGWLTSWNAKGFAKTANPDLWEKLMEAISKAKMSGHTVKFTWVKGHAGNQYNEMADSLAVKASMDTENQLIDKIYEVQESYR